MNYTLAHFGVQDPLQWKRLKNVMKLLVNNGLAYVFHVENGAVSGERFLFAEDLRPLEYLYIFRNRIRETNTATLGWKERKATETFTFPEVTVEVKDSPAMLQVATKFLPGVSGIAAEMHIWAHKREGLYVKARIFRGNKDIHKMRFEDPNRTLNLSTLSETTE